MPSPICWKGTNNFDFLLRFVLRPAETVRQPKQATKGLLDSPALVCDCDPFLVCVRSRSERLGVPKRIFVSAALCAATLWLPESTALLPRGLFLARASPSASGSSCSWSSSSVAVRSPRSDGICSSSFGEPPGPPSPGEVSCGPCSFAGVDAALD